MAQTMIASEKPITDGQIENIVDRLRAALRKHREELASSVTQQVLGVESLGAEMFAVVRKYADRLVNMFSRVVSVDRTRSSQAALDATGRRQYTDKAVVASMPRGEGDEVTMRYFDLDYDPTPTQLQAEYDKRNLKADPIAQAADNAANPSFTDDRPNGCQWDLREDGTASFATFNRWDVEREVLVFRDDGGWFRDYRFGGVRK